MVTEYKASHRYARTTARKARLVVDMIRGLPVNRALTVLDRSPRRAAVLVGKVVRSAVANAEQDSNVDPNHLTVALARVDEGPLLGGHVRWRAGSRGRAMPIRKRTSHIHIGLAPAGMRVTEGRRRAAPAAAAETAPAGDAGTAAAGKAAPAGKGAGKAGSKAKAGKPAKAARGGDAAGGKSGGAAKGASAGKKQQKKKKEG
jgi:large subunit ribosomal protein L22